jgi:hypothetical protein
VEESARRGRENRGPEAAPHHVLPTLWFRNTWSWELDARRPRLIRHEASAGATVVRVTHPELSAEFRLYVEGTARPLFTENETNEYFHGETGAGSARAI